MSTDAAVALTPEPIGLSQRVNGTEHAGDAAGTGDHLIPTTVDVPGLRVAAIIEQPEPGAPYGAEGAGEPPTISSGAAVAVRDASGVELARIPIRPSDIALAPAAGVASP